MPTTGFAQRLKALRQEAGISQEELATLAGLNKFTLAGLEQGRNEPNWETALALAEALQVEVGAFVVPKGQRRAVKKQRRGRPRKVE